uniref:Protein phosphatase 1 regulatory subunit 1A n=1 Tax=Catharus ustulatus TaxID=91951 RepID=A0A8C3UV69_CATUS
MEPNSPRKIQFTVPLLEPHLDPEAAEQVRGHAGTPGGHRGTARGQRGDSPGGLRGAAGSAGAGGDTGTAGTGGGAAPPVRFGDTRRGWQCQGTPRGGGRVVARPPPPTLGPPPPDPEPGTG